ncbi:MAG: hypothetical protein AAGA96_01580 [Verrucomicrobiota bacterium]
MSPSTLGRFAPLASAATLCLLLGYAALDERVRAQETSSSSVIELLTALRMTEEQRAGFQAQEAIRKESQKQLKQLQGEELRAAREAFQEKRRAALQELFSNEQWALWTAYWSGEPGGPAPEDISRSPQEETPVIPRDRQKVPDRLGKTGFVHVERQDGIWFMVNADGERFVPMGMNHVGPMHRFAPYNRDFWIEQFGPETLAAGGQPDWQGPGVKRWMEQIAKDHLDHGFNTLAFHHPATLPTEYFNELGLYYFGKLKMSHVNPKRAPRMGPNGKFPDVFSPAWIQRLDAFVGSYTAKHKDSKYLLGYSFEDLPAYTVHHLEKRITEFEHHPWIIDIITRPGMTIGKRRWIEVLKQQYPTAAEAGAMYQIDISEWADFYEVSEWPLPKDPDHGFADQALMNAKIVEAYLKAHHDALRKHDPNHLIFGDKIQNQRPQPDWVWEIVRKYVDVILIQDYDFYTPSHEKKLRHIYSLTGKPILNGDHSYGVLRPNMTAVKGVKVNSAEDKGKQYATYLRGILNLPFMVGWQTCGYLETWEGTADATGKQQTGYFDPFGEPIEEALSHAREANARALEWHEKAGTLENVYATRGLLGFGTGRAPGPAKAAELSDYATSGNRSDSGSLDNKNEATGRFQVAKGNGRTTLITPEGQPFFSLGVTHIQAIAFPAAGEPDIFGDRFGRDWSAVASEVNENLLAWGYNSTGYGTPGPLGELIPYAEGVLTAPTSMYFGNKQFSYPDVFDSDWQQNVKETLRLKINAHKDNPNLMGIYWTDMPLWDLRYGKRSGKPNWVEAIRALPEHAPGRQRYEAFWAARGDQATDEEFLRLIARTYYEVIGKETRRLAPDTIIFGERYGPSITPSFVIEEAAPWIDAVAVQPYGNEFDAASFDRIHLASGGKGIIICDHNISFPTKEHPKTMWTQLPTVEEVAQAHARYVNEALSKPYILGYHRCQYIDRFTAHQGVLKQGVVKSDWAPYEELVELITETNHTVLARFATKTLMRAEN